MQEYTFLIEIGTESLPSAILKRLGRDFFDQIINGFEKYNISYDKISWFASSCRLAVKAKIIIKSDYNINMTHTNEMNNNENSYGRYIQKTCTTNVFSVTNNGVNVKNNIKIGNFQETLECNKNTVIHYDIKYLLCKIIGFALEKLRNYEMMRWGEIDLPFVRPVRTVTMLLDTYLIPGCFFGVNTSRILYGNRFMEKHKITLEHADCYPDVLSKSGWVIANYDIRKSIIRVGIEKEAKKLRGIVDLVKYDSLLEEVTAQVEWPVVLSGEFDSRFLKLPFEVILHIMRYDQKYFPVFNPIDGLLLPHFVFVAHSVLGNHKSIISGHEQVIAPRLMDAEFFLRNDNKCRLEDYIPKLNTVLFHSKLGTLRDKTLRIEALSGWIADKIGEEINQVKRAGYLCKCDLMSNMVFEFPSTQGIIGMYYARRDGESEKIALAQKEHYLPRFSEDMLPTSLVSCAVSIADKIDTISGIFGIKELPKGNRDPFALKRFAIGIVRILIYKKLSLNLFGLIQESVKLYGSKLINTTVVNDIHNFMCHRLYSWYCSRGYSTDIIKSVLCIENSCVVDIDNRIEAVVDFCRLQNKKNVKLNLIYKRISNILLQQQICSNGYLKNSLFKIPEEVYLARKVALIEKKLCLLCAQHRYYDALVITVTICDPVNAFFENVVIMDKNKNIRMNRLTLLNKVKNLCLKVADIALLNVS